MARRENNLVCYLCLTTQGRATLCPCGVGYCQQCVTAHVKEWCIDMYDMQAAPAAETTQMDETRAEMQ